MRRTRGDIGRRFRLAAAVRLVVEAGFLAAPAFDAVEGLLVDLCGADFGVEALPCAAAAGAAGLSVTAGFWGACAAGTGAETS